MAVQPPGVPGLIEDVIAVPDHPDAAREIAALVGDWYHPGLHVMRLRRGPTPPGAGARFQWIDRPLRFRLSLGDHYACDGRLIGDQRIDWSNGGTWYKDAPLWAHEARIYSENGEDGVTLALLAALGIEHPNALEFGVEDGAVCNTRVLRERGGQVMRWDRDHEDLAAGVHRQVVTLDNIPELVDRYRVRRDLDVLSIDVDYYDFYFWWRLSRHVSPRIVIVEYNSSWGAGEDRVVVYQGPDRGWDTTRYFGASLLALNRLAKRIGYTLVYCDHLGVNAFFVRDDDVEKVRALAPRAGDVPHIYRHARYGAGGHPPDPHNRPFTTAASMLSSPRAIWDPG